MKYFDTPEEAGISSQAITAFLHALHTRHYRLHSLMIARSAGICYADAAEPYTLDTPHRLCSAAKSILSLNLLAAMEEGKLSEEDAVAAFFPEISCDHPVDEANACCGFAHHADGANGGPVYSVV